MKWRTPTPMSSGLPSFPSDYDRLTQRFEEADGYSWKSMVSGVLNGLEGGFKPTIRSMCRFF